MAGEKKNRRQWLYEKRRRDEGREVTKSFQMRCSTSTDADVIAYMESQQNKSGLLKDLVREKMRKEGIENVRKKD